MVIKRYQIFALIFLLPMPAAFAAADCLDKTCVDVFTSDNQLIITAQKGAAKPTPKPATKKPVVKPKPVITVKPTPKPTLKPAPKPIVKPKPVVTKKAIAKPIAKPAVASLSDKLVKLLPVGDINFQPEVDPLVNLPVYFWTQTPTRFTALVPILDVVVYVNLTPTFTWSFGDGSFTTTTDPGGPYPHGRITHVYSNPGTYPVILITTWGGSFEHNSIERTITGQIRKTSALSITVVAAPNRFMN